MSTDALFINFLLCVALAITAWKGFDFLKRYRLITGTPTSKIRAAHQGYVELIGHITESSGLLRSPLSGRECVWFRCRVSRLQSGKKTQKWSIEYASESTDFFEISDTTDSCLVAPEGATIRAEHTRTWYGSTPMPDSAIDKPTSNLNKLNQILNTPLDSERYQYQESLLFPYEKIYALGQFSTTGGGRHLPTLESIKGDIIREWKQSYDNLLDTFDTDNNQKLDMHEWNDVLAAAESTAVERRKELANQPTRHLLCQPAEKDHPYLLSTFDEEALAKRYGWYALGALIALMLEVWAIVNLWT